MDSHYRALRSYRYSITHQEISSQKVNPSATLTPEGSLEEPTGYNKFGEDYTTASTVEEETKEERNRKIPSGMSTVALIERRVLSWIAIPLLLAIIVIGVFFIKDNGAGKLNSLQDMCWAFKKSGIVLVFFYVILVINCIYKKICAKKNKTH